MSKFSGFRKFRLGTTIEDIINFLEHGLSLSFSELQNGLRALNFADNFESFQVTVSIPAGTEVTIPNELKTIPSKRIIVRSNSSDIIDGAEPWTANFVYIRNSGLTDAVVSIVFFR